LLLIFAIWLYSSEVSSFGFQLTINMSHWLKQRLKTDSMLYASHHVTKMIFRCILYWDVSTWGFAYTCKCMVPVIQPKAINVSATCTKMKANVKSLTHWETLFKFWIQKHAVILFTLVLF
jgi:hypothetical protein